MSVAKTYKHVVSLGPSCASKYQIARYMFHSLWPEKSEAEAQNAILNGVGRFMETHFFDWSITPPYAVALYIENRFENCLDRSDLIVSDDGSFIRNTRFDPALPHLIHAGPTGKITEDDIEAGYEAALSKTRYLGDKFLRLLQTPGDYLYVMRSFPPADTVRKLLGLLRQGEHSAEVLLLDKEQNPHDYTEFRGLVHTHELTMPITKPESRNWEGEDADWDIPFRRLIASPVGV